MEQGRVTITKAGINARLNARCSVLAAANPVYGRYDEFKSPMENIGMQDSLLSRFDLLFIILDRHNYDSDNKIADHVVRMHRYRAPTEQDGEPLPIISSADFLTTRDLDNEEDDSETPIFEKYNNLLHGNRSKTEKIVSVNFIKKYIHIAKSMKPVLTDEAREVISEAYAKIRMFEREQEDVARTQPITVRALETMIRLATAHAKGRMSRNVELEDANAAIELVQFAYFKKIIEKPKKAKRRTRVNSDGEEYSDYDDDGDMDVDGDEEEEDSETRKTRKVDVEGEDAQEPMDEEEPAPAAPVEMDVEKLKTFKRLLNACMQKAPGQKLPLEEFVSRALSSTEASFSRGEIDWALQKMEDDNQVLVTEGDIFLI